MVKPPLDGGFGGLDELSVEVCIVAGFEPCCAGAKGELYICSKYLVRVKVDKKGVLVVLVELSCRRGVSVMGRSW